MLDYQRTLNSQRNATDPWNTLANAVVEQAADDYRRLMTRKVNGVEMSEIELQCIDSKISEIRRFFTSDWGYLLSHGLAPVIWERLQGEFATRLAEFEELLEAKFAQEVEDHEREININGKST